MPLILMKFIVSGVLDRHLSDRQLSGPFSLALVLAASLIAALCTANAQEFSTVILDPGHGGKQPGAVYGKVAEKDVNLGLALAVEYYLHNMGINTALTRDRDVTLSLARRARYPSYFHKPLFVSLHYNGAPRASVHGIETFYYSTASQTLAGLIQNALIQATGAHDRGVQHRGFHVIRKNVTPVAVLVEGGFLSHGNERRKIAHPGYRDLQARAIASAIAMFMGQPHSGKRNAPPILVQNRQAPPRGGATGQLIMASAPAAQISPSHSAKARALWRRPVSVQRPASDQR